MIEYKTVSLANQVFERLEKDILGGVYAIGEVISENRLAKDLGVSRTPIREALSRLSEEGLVGESHTGTVVIGITDRDVDDLYEVKKIIEPVAAARAAAASAGTGTGEAAARAAAASAGTGTRAAAASAGTGTGEAAAAAVSAAEAEILEELADIVDRQEFYAGKGDMEKVRDLDTDFHDAVYAASGSRSFQKILSPVHHKIMKFRKASLEANPKRAVDSVAEHKGILEAIRAGDPEKAEKRMREHVERAYRGVLKDRAGGGR